MKTLGKKKKKVEINKCQGVVITALYDKMVFVMQQW